MQGFASVIAAAALLGLPKIGSSGSSLEDTDNVLNLDNSAVGEAYEGFLLLPEGAPVPSYVQCAPAPILCGVEGKPDPTMIGEDVWFKSIDDFAADLSFPIFVPQELPEFVEFVNAYVIRFVQSQDPFLAVVNFGKSSNQTLLSIWAQPNFPRPYPVWSTHSTIPEKVDFLPSPGIMRKTDDGHMLQWIAKDILYTLVVEYEPDLGSAMAAAKSLIYLGQ